MKDQAKALAAVEILVETNEGTYGPAEAGRAIGSGDPRHANYRIYETVGGTRRVEGCDPAKAPGRGRRMNGDELRTRRAELAKLREALATGREVQS